MRYVWLLRDRPIPWVPGGPSAAHAYRATHPHGLNPDEDRLTVTGTPEQIADLAAQLNPMPKPAGGG